MQIPVAQQEAPIGYGCPGRPCPSALVQGYISPITDTVGVPPRTLLSGQLTHSPSAVCVGQ